MKNRKPLTRELDPANSHERDLPCFVHHPDAGGQCERTATIRVYGLHFCEEHGAEIRTGSLMEVRQDAHYFFERFRNPHVPDFNDLVDRELETVSQRMMHEMPDDGDYQRAIRRAYPDTPEDVREGVLAWERDELWDRANAEDCLLDSLATLHKLMRLAHGDGETWLVETLEYERESVAAQAAYAMREAVGIPS